MIPKSVEHVAPAVDVSPRAIAALVAEGERALHEQLPTSPDALDHSTLDLAHAPDALGLLVGVTHDLRSPLSSMLMLIERLRSGKAGPVTPQQEKQLGLLYSATFGVASLTNDALDMARGSLPDFAEGAPIAFSLRDVWASVRSLVQPIAEEKGLVLRWSGPAADRRLGHPAAVYRVLLNLVTNALKFTVSGSVTVTAEPVPDGSNGTLIRFRVEDTGTGLPDPIRLQLENRSPSPSPLAGGPVVSSAGLGIAMCQRVLATLGSQLVAAPAAEPAKSGTVLSFDVVLPIETDAPQ